MINTQTNIRIGVLGNVDSGKSTIIGVLCSNELDDGKGYARSKVMKRKHELESGRTTDVTYNYLHFSNKICNLVDLAGHEKYLRNTLYGVTSSQLNYAIIVVGSNMEITNMTKEHLGIVLFLRIPIIVLLTKIDMAPKDKYDETKREMLKLLSHPLFRKNPVIYENNVSDYVNLLTSNEHINIIPIIPISSKNGHNIDQVRKLLEHLPIIDQNKNSDNLINHPIILNAKTKSDIDHSNVENIGSYVYVEKNYYVNGIGIVLTGNLLPGTNLTSIKKNQILYLGPIITNTKSNNIEDKFIKIRVRSMHNNNRQDVNEIIPGYYLTLAIKPVDNSFELHRNMLYKGIMVFTHLQDVKLMTYDIKVQLKILSSKTLIKYNYSPIIHCNTIRQAVKIIKVFSSDEKAKTNQNIPVIIRMLRFPIFVKPGNIIYLRDGNTKCVGIITSTNVNSNELIVEVNTSPVAKTVNI
jgi:elongation factor 1-alpha